MQSGVRERIRAVTDAEIGDLGLMGEAIVGVRHRVERDGGRPCARSGGDGVAGYGGRTEIDLRDGLAADDHLGIAVGVLPFCRYLQVVIACAVGLIAAEGYRMLRHHDGAVGTCLSAADAARRLYGEHVIIGPVARVWRHFDDYPLPRGDGRGGGAAGRGRGL